MNADTTHGWKDRGHRPRAILGVFVLIAAVACVVIFIVLRRSPQEVAAKVPVSRGTESRLDTPEVPAAIHGRGVVVPKARVQIMPEVSGRAVYVHSQLHGGGVIRANEKILQIDPSSYELAVRRARAVADEAQARLDLERTAGDMRRQQGQPSDFDRQADLPLFVREPQVRQAEAMLESTKTELMRAELELSRTSVALPYDVLVVGQTISLGQYVGMGQSIATAYGTDVFEIEVPIRDEDLARLDAWGGLSLPGRDSKSTPMAAEIKAVVAGAEHMWQGRVVRTTGEMDRVSGRISVVVEVPQPLDPSTGRPPLLPGTAVEVLIPGVPKAGTPQNTENVGDF